MLLPPTMRKKAKSPSWAQLSLSGRAGDSLASNGYSLSQAWWNSGMRPPSSHTMPSTAGLMTLIQGECQPQIVNCCSRKIRLRLV